MGAIFARVGSVLRPKGGLANSFEARNRLSVYIRKKFWYTDNRLLEQRPSEELQGVSDFQRWKTYSI
jgi:hypothetical protein